MSAEYSIPLSSLWYRWLSEIEIITKFFSSGTAQIVLGQMPQELSHHVLGVDHLVINQQKP